MQVLHVRPCTYCVPIFKIIQSPTSFLGPLHITSENASNRFPSIKTLRPRNVKTQQSSVILDFYLRKTRAKKSHYYVNVIVFEKPRFQSVSCLLRLVLYFLHCAINTKIVWASIITELFYFILCNELRSAVPDLVMKILLSALLCNDNNLTSC